MFPSPGHGESARPPVEHPDIRDFTDAVARFLETEIKKDEIPMLDTPDFPEAPQPREMIDMEATFEKLEHELQEVNQNAEQLKKNFLELLNII